MSPTRAAGLIVFRNVNQAVQFLMLQTSYGEHHWTPPKGHVDPGESDWITALRETKEESGLTENELQVYKDICKTLNYEVKGKPKAVVYWLAKLKNPEHPVKLSSEHQDLKWLPLHQAQEIAGYEDMKALLADFHEKAQKL
ncbi:hypothetical protein K1T71_010142 [Dendrolimus kikuchii]|uniref:Uncharacterized protein n=1 Tax=Dendrolimus kikuchii TaxID=765133 RepID=A0ACC1CQY8_9NEOP|nr:hypothetical protein K1T71_010142 [Dendrolimus kikuchii]